jgi:hypothetical protein
MPLLKENKMKFKAIASKKQFCGFKGLMIQAVDGFYHTDDNDIIEFLSKNPNWQKVETISKKVVETVENVAESIGEALDIQVKPKRKNKSEE